MDGKKTKIIIKKSVVVVGNLPEVSNVEELLKRFDVANSTPVDCLDFLRRLKSLLK